MTDTAVAPTFRIIGENIHTTRIIRRPGPLVGPDDEGRESILFVDELGKERTLPIPDEERRLAAIESARRPQLRLAGE